MTDETEATVREGPGTSAPRHEAAEEEPRLSRGTLVGRYVVLDVLGAGGMGVVYAAFDPELDRKVAIKLLQASTPGSESGGQAWLLREAQAMAKLSHPNVIAVHDVGTLPGERVFVAMELVVGKTLRRWLDGKRAWRDVVGVLRAAGAGLAAAHAAGIVHRDFKPDNVLVGDDGRVRVMDFGLARRPGEDDELRGHLAGTPAYLAPELYAGEPADARSDQFAFGVALFEALYGERPFDKGVPDKPKEPGDAGVPARVRRVVMRAIAIDPRERYASMDELLAELAIDPMRARRRVTLAAIAVVLVAAIGGGVFAIAHSRAQLCKGMDRKLAGVWDDHVERAVRAAFIATKQPRAAAAADAVARVLDAYAAEWTATAVGSCEATRIHGDQTEGDMALRQDCLDARIGELRAFTQLLANADATLVVQAEKGAQGLDPIAACSNLPVLRAPNRPPPEARAKIEQIRDKLAAAKAALLAGKLGAAINRGNEIVELARS
ncbi:MAG: serine/threonine-protein kinase, partial [Acidobacteriota bacterium]